MHKGWFFSRWITLLHIKYRAHRIDKFFKGKTRKTGKFFWEYVKFSLAIYISELPLVTKFSAMHFCTRTNIFFFSLLVKMEFHLYINSLWTSTRIFVFMYGKNYGVSLWTYFSQLNNENWLRKLMFPTDITSKWFKLGFTRKRNKHSTFISVNIFQMWRFIQSNLELTKMNFKSTF